MTTDRDDRVREVLSINPTQESPRNSEGDVIALRDGRLLLAYSRFTGGSGDNSAAHIAARFLPTMAAPGAKTRCCCRAKAR